MSLKNRTLQATLLFLGAFALLAVVPGAGRTQDKDKPGKEDKDKPVKEDKDKPKDEAKGGKVAAPGALRDFTGFVRSGYPAGRVGPVEGVVLAGPKDEEVKE